MKKKFFLLVFAMLNMQAYAQTGSAPVLSSAGRDSCGWVQLWAGGPKWATFNVGATITDYSSLQVGADATAYYNYSEEAPYYNTANVGGLYAWSNPNKNGRNSTWNNTTSLGYYDAASVLWGSNWQTPTLKQLDSLTALTSKIWCDGIKIQFKPGCTLTGYKISGLGEYSNYSIFLPAAGQYSYGNQKINYASYYGEYWSRTTWNSDESYSLLFDNTSYIRGQGTVYRRRGLSIRAILISSTPTNIEKAAEYKEIVVKKKVLMNGNLFIIDNNKIYNAQGIQQQ